MFDLGNSGIQMMTAGESHGKGYTIIIEGIPAGIEITEVDIQRELDRRKPGQSAFTTQRKESDRAEILSGVFEGKTLGSPICVFVPNKDAQSKDYDKLKKTFRPGHADYTHALKYAHRDHRGGGRSSGRETLTRMIANAFCKKILVPQEIEVLAYSKRIGDIVTDKKDIRREDLDNPFLFPEKNRIEDLERYIQDIKSEGDSIGGQCQILAKNIPPGLGGPFYDSLKAKLAYALTTIPAITAIEFGSGTAASQMKGSTHNDPMKIENKKAVFTSNNHGGILGGISSGNPLEILLTVKPPSSISKEQEMLALDSDGALEVQKMNIEGRHDPCLLPRFCPVAEAMVNLVLASELISSGNIRTHFPQ